MLAFLGALRGELVDIEKHMVAKEASFLGNYPVCRGKYEGKDVLLVQTGTGKEKAETATQLVLDSYPITALISLGFAGALNHELKIGDIVIYSKLHCADGKEFEELSEIHFPDSTLVSRISQALENAEDARFRHGASVTVAKPAQLPETKLALGKTFGAEAVDMESYWIAKIASVRQIPFIAVRAISDTVQDILPHFDLIFTPDGKVIWGKAARYLISHPKNSAMLPILYKNSLKAGKNLNTVAHHIVMNYEAVP